MLTGSYTTTAVELEYNISCKKQMDKKGIILQNIKSIDNRFYIL